jgi:hypothetical protein
VGCHFADHDDEGDGDGGGGDDDDDDDDNDPGHDRHDDDAGKAGGVDPANGLPSCELAEVPRLLEQVVDEEHKTPLFLDTSSEQKACSYEMITCMLRQEAC